MIIMFQNTHLHLQFGDAEAVMLVSDEEAPDREFVPGETISFSIAPDKVHLFSLETECNLEW